MTFFVPCITFGKNAESAGVTSCMLGTLAFLVPLVNLFCLVKVRGEYWAKSENVEFLTIEDRGNCPDNQRKLNCWVELGGEREGGWGGVSWVLGVEQVKR